VDHNVIHYFQPLFNMSHVLRKLTEKSDIF
jgi:hypothetical protein